MTTSASFQIAPKPTGPDAPKPEPKTAPLTLPDPKTDPAPDPKSDPAPDPKTDPAPDPKSDPVTEALISDAEIEQFTKEVTEGGKLSDESLKTLEARRIPRNLAVQYVQGLQAQQQMQARTIYDTVGGKENFEAFQKWASAKLNDSERTDYNTALNSGDLTKAVNTLKGYHARFTQENGTNPSLAGGGRGSTGPVPFESTYQMVEAMKDPKYGKDEAYRKAVIARVAVSNFN